MTFMMFLWMAVHLLIVTTICAKGIYSSPTEVQGAYREYFISFNAWGRSRAFHHFVVYNKKQVVTWWNKWHYFICFLKFALVSFSHWNSCSLESMHCNRWILEFWSIRYSCVVRWVLTNRRCEGLSGLPSYGDLRRIYIGPTNLKLWDVSEVPLWSVSNDIRCHAKCMMPGFSFPGVI